jgi:hypothetical protein
MKKRYYLVEPLDIDGDKNPDGFLVSQYRIDKYGNKIFLKNKYVTFEALKTSIKGGARIIRHRPRIVNKRKQAEKMVILSQAEYNEYLNSKQVPVNHHYNRNVAEQPTVVINGSNPSFLNSFGHGIGSGFGLGVGVTVGAAVGDAAVNGISGLFGFDE